MDLIQMLTERLGISDGEAKQGAGFLFQKLKDAIPDGDFSKISEAIPDMDDLLGAAPADAGDAEEAGGLMGMIGGAASKLGLDGVGNMADMVSGFDKLGLDGAKLPEFVSTILEFIEEKLGVDAKAIVEKFFQ